ncbi:MAG: VWA domain-containing protein [Candidatus Sulfotelmatobacter sp.]
MRSAALWGVGSIISALLISAALAISASAQPLGQTAAQAAVQPAGPAAAPVQSNNPQPTSAQAPPDTSEKSESAPQNVAPDQQPTAQPPSSDDQGMFVFKKQIEEVVLHATVVDQEGHLVTGLDRGAFTVFEAGQPQTITSFRREDVPVELGIVVDNSGSMRDKRGQINQAVLNLVHASNPDDQVFVVNFGQRPYLDQDFTSDVNLLQAALHQVSAKGSTALYDAIVASAVHLENNSRLNKKVLLVITDGQDNMSQETLQEASRQLQQANGPTVYAIGLTGGGLRGSGRAALEQLAAGTGGVAYFPDSLDQVDTITRTVARDIRSQYIIAYKPRVQGKPDYQTLHVEAHAPGYGQLTVRTRSGYYAPEPSH